MVACLAALRERKKAKVYIYVMYVQLLIRKEKSLKYSFTDEGWKAPFNDICALCS